MYGGANRWYYGLYSRWGQQRFSVEALFAPNEYEREYQDAQAAQGKQEELNNQSKKGAPSGKEAKEKVAEEIRKSTLGGYSAVQQYGTYAEENLKQESPPETPRQDEGSGFFFKEKSLIGAIANTSENGFDADGEMASVMHYYAAYIDDEVLHSSRITGGAYGKLPWVKGGKGFVLSANESESYDFNVGAHVGPQNTSLGVNTGESRQVQG